MKQNQYLVPAAILALAIVILIVAFKPNKESVSNDGMSKETTTLATPSARGGVTAPEMLPLLAKVTELTEKTVQSQNEARSAQNEAQSAKSQAEQLASKLRAANQALEMSQQEVARLAKTIQDANDRSIKVGMHISKAVSQIGSPSEIVAFPLKFSEVYLKIDWGNKYDEPHRGNIEYLTKLRYKYATGKDSVYWSEISSTPSVGVNLSPKPSVRRLAPPTSVENSLRVLYDDFRQARSQDPHSIENDDQAWLIGDQWIFIDKNKIITAIGPSQYTAKK